MAFAFKLNNTSGVPFYRQVVNQVVYGVANGVLKPGERLPTVRQLAVDLQVNLNTVVKAYGELELRGIVNSQQGTGTFVSEDKASVDPRERQEGLERLCGAFLDEVSALGIGTQDACAALERVARIRGNRKEGS